MLHDCLYWPVPYRDQMIHMEYGDILADVSSHMSCSEAVYWGLPNIPFYLK